MVYMWNEHNYNPEELKIVKEFEYPLFMFNPGFRAMWHDNFEEYFKGTQSQEYWDRQEEIRSKELDKIFEENMRDLEYASWRHEMAVIEETLFGDPNESYIAKSRWYEREQMMTQTEESERKHDSKLRNDRLYNLAKKWSMDVLNLAGPKYENTKNLDWFRILTNCLTVSGKIVFASRDLDDEIHNDPEMFLWRTDRAGYILSLTSLQRCIDSFRRLPPDRLASECISRGLEMQLELADRLDRIEQNYLKSQNKHFSIP